MIGLFPHETNKGFLKTWVVLHQTCTAFFKNRFLYENDLSLLPCGLKLHALLAPIFENQLFQSINVMKS